jgi:hypothetical protein
MRLSSVLELKEAISKDLREQAELQLVTSVQGLVNPRFESRLAIGYSRVSRNNFWLELRVQRGEGVAFNRAMEIKEEAKGEANIEIIPHVEVPFRIDIPEKGRVRLTEWRRPLEIGYSIGHLDGGAGTLGSFVELANGHPGLLSNNHVLALFNYAERKDYIYQPGRQDVRPQLATNRIAKLENFVPLSRTERNPIDAAIAAILDDMSFRGNVIPSGIYHPKQGSKLKIGDPLNLTAGTVVNKIGRTTGFTRGLVKAIALDNVPVRTQIGNLMFDDTIEIEWFSNSKPFTKPGDSGSVVFVEDDLRVIGLHFAGGQIQRGARTYGVSYSCNIRTVLDAFGVSLMRY